MNTHQTFAADVFRFVIAAVFVTMTMAFLTLPYALSSHPGEPTQVASTTVRHLS